MVQIRLSIFTTSDFPYRGAPESFVRHMALGFAENEFCVEVIRFWGNRYNNQNYTDITCVDYLFKKPFKNEFLKFLEFSIQFLFIPFFIGYRKFIKKDNVMILYGIDRLVFALPISIFCKLFKIKCIRVITEIYNTKSYAVEFWRKPNILLNEWQLKYGDRYLDGIIVLSHFLKNISISGKVKKERIILIPNFTKININFNDKFEKHNNDVIIGFCGSPSIQNGVLDLVKAYKILLADNNNIKLKIIGNIEEKILREINQLVPSNSIILTGLLLWEDAIIEILKCDIMVNPRVKGIHADSGFPTKIGEYFAAKKPVVATKVGDLSYYFEDGIELIFANANDPNSIANGIDKFLKDSELATRVSLNGFNWAVNNLDYFNNSKRIIDFFDLKN